MRGWARKYVGNVGARVLAASAVIALTTAFGAMPAGAISRTGAAALPARALPTPSVPALVLPAPAATSVPGTLAPVVIAPLGGTGPAVAPRVLGLVPSLLVGPSAAVQAVISVVPPIAPAARPLSTATAPVRSAHGLVAALGHSSSRSVAPTGQPPDRLSASGSTIRSLSDGGDIQIVPRSQCTSQVASVQPGSAALCTSVTPQAAAELGLSSSPDRSPFDGLPVTGASIAGLAVVGASLLGLGGVSRARRRAALA